MRNIHTSERKRSNMKVLIAIAMCFLLFFCGCACEPQQSPIEGTATPNLGPTAEQVTDPLARLTGAYMLSGESETLTGGSHDSFFADEVAVLVSGGALQSTELHINKTGDSENISEALSYGLNAAVAVLDIGSAVLADALISTNGLGAVGVFCTGDGTTAALNGGMVATASDASPAIAALSGATVTLDGTELLADSIDSPCLLARVGGHIQATGVRGSASESLFLALDNATTDLANCTLIGSGAHLTGASKLTAEGGALTGKLGDALFTIEKGAATVLLTGVTLNPPEKGALLRLISGSLSLTGSYQALAGEIRCEEGTELSLSLQNNSSYTGSLSTDARMYIHLSLDATSRWFVTGDSYIEALTNADETFQNIESNGFTIYYNSENTANAWLQSKPYALPGGGYLSPMI